MYVRQTLQVLNLEILDNLISKTQKPEAKIRRVKGKNQQ